METREPGGEAAPGVGGTNMPMGQAGGADEQIQPMGRAPDAAPAQTPPTMPPTRTAGLARWSSVGGALWLAFAFGMGVAIFWSLAHTGLAQIDQPLQLSVIGGHRLPIFTLIAVSIDLALPVVILVVAWRASAALARQGSAMSSARWPR